MDPQEGTEGTETRNYQLTMYMGIHTRAPAHTHMREWLIIERFSPFSPFPKACSRLTCGFFRD